MTAKDDIERYLANDVSIDIDTPPVASDNDGAATMRRNQTWGVAKW